MSATRFPSDIGHARPQAAVALAAVVAGTAIALGVPQPRLAALLLIGVLCGVTLYHSAFGFTAAYRNLLFRRDGAGVKAQLLMLAAATVLFAPVLASGNVFGREVAGASAPFGWQVAIGAFLFGAGMQLGGGCGSGTLYALGGGSVRMLATLIAFCAGGFWASLHMEAWKRLPHSGELVLGEALGWTGAAGLQLLAVAVLYALVRACEARPAAAAPSPQKWECIFTGPWPLATGAVALALLNLATLLASGHPWSITWAFTLWGAKVARMIGWDPSASPYWNNPFQREALDASILADETSVMDIGILAGALLASALAARFAPGHRVPARSLAAAIAGGLLMGYGARIAYGCNIGAFFSGVASSSLHGWLWIAAALPGTWLGARMRPFFGLPV